MDTKIIKQLVTLCLFLLMGIVAQAQNSIDEQVDNISTLGSSKFTSVVDRDPKTRQINKVVKVLQVPGIQVGKLRNAFLKEKDSGNFSHTKDSREETMTLTVESPKRIRIYMLRMEMLGQHAYSSGKVTVIVKNNGL
ncbi:MAG: DUF5024 domain-containing protein [Prevotella sp.]|nr:DUF5024 domain-containing protein [Prevotella sp.]MBP5507274.1 DUF5024 domain-containing protein [Prevotella sp.]